VYSFFEDGVVGSSISNAPAVHPSRAGFVGPFWYDKEGTTELATEGRLTLFPLGDSKVVVCTEILSSGLTSMTISCGPDYESGLRGRIVVALDARWFRFLTSQWLWYKLATSVRWMPSNCSCHVCIMHRTTELPPATTENSEASSLNPASYPANQALEIKLRRASAGYSGESFQSFNGDHGPCTRSSCLSNSGDFAEGEFWAQELRSRALLV
jgi:hypothetical protein